MIDAKTPQAALKIESDDTRMDARYVVSSIGCSEETSTNEFRMLKDERVRQPEQRTIFDVREAAEKLG